MEADAAVRVDDACAGAGRAAGERDDVLLEGRGGRAVHLEEGDAAQGHVLVGPLLRDGGGAGEQGPVRRAGGAVPDGRERRDTREELLGPAGGVAAVDQQRDLLGRGAAEREAELAA